MHFFSPGHTVRLFGQKKTTDGRKAGGASLLLPKVRKNPLIEIISINTGSTEFSVLLNSIQFISVISIESTPSLLVFVVIIE